MGDRRMVTVALTRAQYEALAACVALHSAEDDDYPGDRARAGEARAREAGWAKIHDAWHSKKGPAR